MHPIRQPIFAALILLAAVLPSAAQDGRAVWTFSQYDADQGGGTTYVLSYGVPETDAVAFTAICRSGMRGPSIPVTLSVDFGNASDGAFATARIQSGRFNAAYAGAVSVESSESAGVRIDVATNDPLWGVLASNGTAAFSADGRQPVTVSLRGAAGPVENFLQTCRGVFAETDAGTPAPSQLLTYQYVCDDGTRFRAQFDNSRSYSIAILSFASGPEVPLIQAISGSGVRYANGDITVFTKADDAVLSRIGRPDVNCRGTSTP